MILKQIKINNIGINEITNCYIVFDEKTKEAMVIDPGGEPEKIIAMLDILDAKLKYIYITHCHGDHIGGLKVLKESKGGKILIHYLDAEGLYNNEISLTGYIGIDEVNIEADSRLNDEDLIHIGNIEFKVIHTPPAVCPGVCITLDLIHIGNIEFKVIHTPGHTAGGTSLYCKEEKLLFSGDTLFHGTWGRTDLPTGSFKDIINSITNKLLKLPEDTIVYPGHGKSTMIREEIPIYCELRPRED